MRSLKDLLFLYNVHTIKTSHDAFFIETLEENSYNIYSENRNGQKIYHKINISEDEAKYFIKEAIAEAHISRTT